MTFDISLLEPNDVSINLKLFKLLYIFPLFDPKSKTICNFNVYHLAWYIINCVIGCIVVYGFFGYFTEMEDEIDIVDQIQLIYMYLLYSVGLLKIATFLYKANKIWDLLRVTNIHFLTSTQCQTHIGILLKYRKKSIKISNTIICIGIVNTIQWTLYPQVLLLLQKFNAYQSNRRFENIMNFRFPVTINDYNNNYVKFYMMESSTAVFLFYINVVIDIFFISICFVIIAQYEMIKRAYESVNSELNSENNNEKKNEFNVNNFEDLVSIMKDQQKLFAKLKLFYTTYKFIILSTVIINSGSMVILTFASVVVFTSSESMPIFGVIKLISAFGYMLIVLFFICYLLERINNKMKSVHFGMYNSGNWTSMNLRSKKMLLLSMQLNNANEFMIKLTPRKIVNLQLFNSVIVTCYNVLSAMLNTRSK
ncbi:uncharacterized protein LOC132930615 isoform X2 [Rhopalosiphum padi]|uniref:uncharacterized protein LOC132930615 isoform X2 n=1 Tax=Rhopalosiphum padi TaxID=40932 RepID=UPI00298E7BC9|nr:uncharacterized protein LOC132930615 isoform X2 [Rhopalosiphum padi]